MLKEEDVAMRMLNYRIKRGMTQKQLAKVLGISEATANHAEQNIGLVSMHTLVRINLKLEELEKGE